MIIAALQLYLNHRSVNATQGATQTDYLYHGWQVCEEHDTSSGDSITQQYVYSLDSIWSKI